MMENTNINNEVKTRVKSPLWLQYRPAFDSSDEMNLLKEESIIFYAYFMLLFNFLARQESCEYFFKNEIDYRKLMLAIKIKTREELNEFLNYLIELELLFFDGEKMFMPHLKRWSEPYFNKIKTGAKSKQKTRRAEKEKKLKKIEKKNRKTSIKSYTNNGGAKSVPTRYPLEREIEREIEREEEEKKEKKEEREYIQDSPDNFSFRGEKTQAPTCENEDPKTSNEKVELMNESLSNLRNEVKEKKEVPTKKIADTNLIQGEININDFSPFSEFFMKERNLKVTNKHFNFFVKWYNKRKADRLGNTIKASIYYSILEKDFRQDFEIYLKNREIEEMQLRAIREQDSKQDEKLKALKIPANSMIEFIENLQLKTM